MSRPRNKQVGGGAPPNRKVIAGSVPNSEKTIHSYPGSPGRNLGEYLSWRFDLIYREPVLGWDTVNSADRDLIHDYLKDFEAQTAAELWAGGNPGKTYTNLDDMPRGPARARLLDAYDDEDAIHRLNCGGRRRLFGFRRGNIFLILWWDRNHEVWPARLRHT